MSRDLKHWKIDPESSWETINMCIKERDWELNLWRIIQSSRHLPVEPKLSSRPKLTFVASEYASPATTYDKSFIIVLYVDGKQCWVEDWTLKGTAWIGNSIPVMSHRWGHNSLTSWWAVHEGHQSWPLTCVIKMRDTIKGFTESS